MSDKFGYKVLSYNPYKCEIIDPYTKQEFNIISGSRTGSISLFTSDESAINADSKLDKNCYDLLVSFTYDERNLIGNYGLDSSHELNVSSAIVNFAHWLDHPNNPPLHILNRKMGIMETIDVSGKPVSIYHRDVETSPISYKKVALVYVNVEDNEDSLEEALQFAFNSTQNTSDKTVGLWSEGKKYFDLDRNEFIQNTGYSPFIKVLVQSQKSKIDHNTNIELALRSTNQFDLLEYDRKIYSWTPDGFKKSEQFKIDNLNTFTKNNEAPVSFDL